MNVLERDIQEIRQEQQIDWNALYGKTVLITGATGLIGSLCVKTLLTVPGVQVIALVRNSEKAKTMFGDTIQYIVGDIREEVSYEGPIDYIIHCAAVTTSKMMVDTPVETFEIAMEGTRSMLHLAQKKNVKSIVYLSSMEVYGRILAEQNPVTEEKMGYVDLSKPRSSYPEGKRACELICSAYYHEYQIPVRIARLAQTFGAGIPLSDNRMSMQFARSAKDGKDIVLHTAGRSISNFCYTVDAVKGLFFLLLHGQDGEAYNICNDAESRSIKEIAELVCEKVAKGNISVRFDIPRQNTFGYAPDTEMRLCSDKIRQLGWKPTVSMEEGYRRLTSYLAEEE